MRELTHFINGAHLAGTSGRFADIYNPTTGEVQGRVPLASTEELDLAVSYAAAAQPAWSAVSLQRRAIDDDEIRGTPEPRYGQVGRYTDC